MAYPVRPLSAAAAHEDMGAGVADAAIGPRLKKYRYKKLSAEGAALPMWKEFSSVEKIVEWCFQPRFGDSQQLSVVQLELEAGDGKDASWRRGQPGQTKSSGAKIILELSERVLAWQ